eukprot:GEMP01032969.1.p1 GENE.GEMP01032969.1~~GEMP01032969.1.p1  ORF type:complete len:568 (+),score=133.55 GEMP01032969.1:164-1867(+)
MIHVNLAYKNESFPIRLEAEDRLVVVFDFLREVTPLSVETCTMIYKGKKLPLFAVAKDVVVDGAKILLIGSTGAEVDYVKQARADPLVKGFDALERDEKLRRKRLLQKLVTDPGIVKIMTEHRFVVGILTEMSPAEAQERMAREGKSGDLLGFNENYGARIVLRIRTDDVRGFRPYYDLINTLIHELTHNVFGPHDDKFWALFRELKADYDRFHDGWSRNGKTIGSDGIFSGFENDSDDDDDAVVATPLGGQFVADRTTVRKLAAERAMARLAVSSDANANPAKVPKSSSTHKTASAAVPTTCSCSAHNAGAGTTHGPHFGGPITPDHENDTVARTIDEPPVNDVRPESPYASNRIPGIFVDDNGDDVRPESPYASNRIPDGIVVDDAAALPCCTTPPPGPASTPSPPGAVEGPMEATPHIPHSTVSHIDAHTAVSGAGDNLAPTSGAIGGASEAGICVVEDLGVVLGGIESSGLEWFHAFQGAVRELPPQALSTLHTLARNLKLHPDDPKFRTVKATAPRVQILASSGGDKCMQLLGFERKSDQYTMDTGRIDLGKFIMACEMLES